MSDAKLNKLIDDQLIIWLLVAIQVPPVGIGVNDLDVVKISKFARIRL